MSFSVILLAAGSGLRMGGSVKKQFMSVAGHPLIYHPLSAFENSPVDDIILVVSEEDIPYVKTEIVDHYHCQKVVHIVPGGSERFLSVYEGLKRVQTPWVLIHDGARACVSQTVIADAMAATRHYHACEIAVPSVDTVKIADDDGFVAQTPDRSLVWSIQTPQGFSTELLTSAYEKLLSTGDTVDLTDDAMVVERAFPEQPIKLVPGDYANIKVTTPVDLATAERTLRERGIAAG